MEKTSLIRVAHSPDPDDAFMFYALTHGKIDTAHLRLSHVLGDIETLNRKALQGEYELTALSFHAYAYAADKYLLLSTGASMGNLYGPLIVSKREIDLPRLKDSLVAVPGTLTTAFLVLQLLEPNVKYTVMPFDQIIHEVVSGRVDAGLIIHEGQLTYMSLGLHRVIDLGQWWGEQTGLPLPLGGNAVRRDLGLETMRLISRLLRESINYALQNRTEALRYALRFARGLDSALVDRFVRMYVNEMTLDCGSVGKEAIRQLLQWGHESGALPEAVNLEFVD